MLPGTMVELTQRQEDDITNALIVGMALEDAYVLAGLPPALIADLSEDDHWQRKFHKLSKEHEYGLLERLGKIMEKQERAGREGATTWALEHMYPQRYANKNVGEGRTVNIVLDGHKDPADDAEVVEIHA